MSAAATPATVMADVHVAMRGARGETAEARDYDGQERGPVAARDALASSIPAVSMNITGPSGSISIGFSTGSVGVPAISETMELMVQNISPLQEPGRYRRFLTEYIRGDKEGGMSFYHLNKILLGMGEKPIYLAEFKEYLWHMSLHHAKNIMQRPPIGNW